MSMEIVLEGADETLFPTPAETAVETVTGMRFQEVLDHCTLEQRRRCGSELCCLTIVRSDEKEHLRTVYRNHRTVFSDLMSRVAVDIYKPRTILTVKCERTTDDCVEHVTSLCGSIERIIEVSSVAVREIEVATGRATAAIVLTANEQMRQRHAQAKQEIAHAAEGESEIILRRARNTLDLHSNSSV